MPIRFPLAVKVESFACKAFHEIQGAARARELAARARSGIYLGGLRRETAGEGDVKQGASEHACDC